MRLFEAADDLGWRRGADGLHDGRQRDCVRRGGGDAFGVGRLGRRLLRLGEHRQQRQRKYYRLDGGTRSEPVADQQFMERQPQR